MKTKIIVIISALLLSVAALAEESVLEYVAEACKSDKEKFCSQVTPGNPKRMLACAYAHEDQLSGQCSHALYQAASILQQAAASLEYLAKECKGDVEVHCPNVKMGEGRILTCLHEHSDKLSAGCDIAMDETVEFVE